MEPNEKIGDCEFCGEENLTVREFDIKNEVGRTNFREQDTVRLCRVCRKLSATWRHRLKDLSAREFISVIRAIVAEQLTASKMKDRLEGR